MIPTYYDYVYSGEKYLCGSLSNIVEVSYLFLVAGYTAREKPLVL